MISLAMSPTPGGLGQFVTVAILWLVVIEMTIGAVRRIANRIRDRRARRRALRQLLDVSPPRPASRTLPRHW